MKTIDANAINVKKALCPFCSYGCEFGVVFNDFGIKGVEYVKSGSSDGRLCPRGSAAAIYLDHPKRLTTPLKKGVSIDWSRMGKELTKIMDSPKSVAATVDRNVTPEEYSKILGFCKKIGIEDVATTYFEPEYYLRRFFDKPFSMENIESADCVVVLGDPFNHAPMSSRSIIEWKLSDRNHSLFVIDTLNTHTARFADRFLRANVGTEPLLLFGLAQEKIEGADVAKVTGIDDSLLKEVSAELKAAKKGVIFACLSFGHTYDPMLVAEGLARLQEFSRMRVVPLVEFYAHEGTDGYATLVEKVKRKKIKYLLNFGELFPFYYPQLVSDMKGADIYATSPLKFSDHNVLPVPLNLEKEGTVITTFGKKRLAGGIEPPSGAKNIEYILDMIAQGYGEGKARQMNQPKVDVRGRVRRLAELALPKKENWRLIGEKIAFNFMGFFDSEHLKVNPSDAVDLGIKANDIATITSANGSCDLAVKVSEDVGNGIVAVPAETPAVRGLFDYEIDDDTKGVNFLPTEVKICRKE